MLREDWATAEQIERVQLQLLDVVDFINRFRTPLRRYKVKISLMANGVTFVRVYRYQRQDKTRRA